MKPGSNRMTCTEEYKLILFNKDKKLELSLTANDIGHAQAQSSDIARSLKASLFELTYGATRNSKLSELYRRLAYSDFNHKECTLWKGAYTNATPVIYALNNRYYVRPLILDYMEMNRDLYVKPSCGNKSCINPFHNTYKSTKASKMTSADVNLAVAFASQGAPVKEIAKALKVHRSTIYRTLNRERFHSGTPRN
jgi:hypothetical protein